MKFKIFNLAAILLACQPVMLVAESEEGQAFTDLFEDVKGDKLVEDIFVVIANLAAVAVMVALVKYVLIKKVRMSYDLNKLEKELPGIKDLLKSKPLELITKMESLVTEHDNFLEAVSKENLQNLKKAFSEKPTKVDDKLIENLIEANEILHVVKNVTTRVATDLKDIFVQGKGGFILEAPASEAALKLALKKFDENVLPFEKDNGLKKIEYIIERSKTLLNENFPDNDDFSSFLDQFKDSLKGLTESYETYKKQKDKLLKDFVTESSTGGINLKDWRDTIQKFNGKVKANMEKLKANLGDVKIEDLIDSFVKIESSVLSLEKFNSILVKGMLEESEKLRDFIDELLKAGDNKDFLQKVNEKLEELETFKNLAGSINDEELNLLKAIKTGGLKLSNVKTIRKVVAEKIVKAAAKDLTRQEVAQVVEAAEEKGIFEEVGVLKSEPKTRLSDLELLLAENLEEVATPKTEINWNELLQEMGINDLPEAKVTTQEIINLFRAVAEHERKTILDAVKDGNLKEFKNGVIHEYQSHDASILVNDLITKNYNASDYQKLVTELKAANVRIPETTTTGYHSGVEPTGEHGGVDTTGGNGEKPLIEF